MFATMIKKSTLCFAVGGALAAASPASAEIVGLWHFDGDYSDASGNGSTLGWAPGDAGFDDTNKQVGSHALHAGNVSGVSSVVRLNLGPEASALDGKTEVGLSFWVYRNAEATGSARLFAFSKGQESDFGLQLTHKYQSSAHQYYLQNSGLGGFGGQWGHTVSIPYQEWTHVAITSDGETARIFINNVQLSWTSAVNGDGINLGNYLHLGGQSQGTGGRIDSYIDEFIMYDGATDADWVDGVYQAGLAGQNIPEPGSAALALGGALLLLSSRRRRVSMNS
ncbi:LamG-like jellyroll fold domain-containing protein [Phycisphaerales bacterium AB-hyl4]|uniref:LamG-like jellyroll fold domain-containing protein n=1 Tax=Natronomicrosphaera hydrolytica TaxID=3242702 RepID=A0ABV4U7F8_9BACT